MKIPQEHALAEFRRSARCKVDRSVLAQHRRLGEFQIHLRNVSAHGFMAQGTFGFQLGERLSVRLPVVGWIEAHLVWAHSGRAGFEFERLIRLMEYKDLCTSLHK